MPDGANLEELADPNALLSVKQVAAMTTLAKNTLYTWQKQGKPPQGFRLGGRLVYRAAVVEAWLAEQEQAGSGGAA
jgi:predicted DNA-binding transcriptional regulator AlpA